MSCGPLASTGLPVLAVLSLAGLLLAAGVALIVASRSRRGRTATVVLTLLVISGGLSVGAAVSDRAYAASTDCAVGPRTPSSSASGGHSATGPTAVTAHLSIVQTSTMTGMAPGVAPVKITGRITNRGTRSTFVATVTVSITGITGPARGSCGASDYVLLDTVMPVGRTLAPGGSADFTGARIGFVDKAVNQDACQHAGIDLRYVSS
jgi:hypothetical protein